MSATAQRLPKTATDVSLNDELIREHMKSTQHRVDITYKGSRVEFIPKQKIVREKNEEGNMTSSLEFVYGEDGEQEFEEREFIEYEIIRGEVRCGGEIDMRHLMAVDINAPNDDYGAGISKARGASLLQQIEDSKGGVQLPADHLPIEKWGAMNKSFIAIFRHNRIYTVQQVRDMTMAQMARLPGGVQAQRLQAQATAYLTRESMRLNTDGMNTIKAENEAQKNELNELKNMVKMLMDKLDGKQPPTNDQQQAQKKIAAPVK
jgi:hypothetical protein